MLRSVINSIMTMMMIMITKHSQNLILDINREPEQEKTYKYLGTEENECIHQQMKGGLKKEYTTRLTLILLRSRTGTVWFYTSTSNKRAARLKLYTESLTRDLKLMYSRLTLVRISIKL